MWELLNNFLCICIYIPHQRQRCFLIFPTGFSGFLLRDVVFQFTVWLRLPFWETLERLYLYSQALPNYHYCSYFKLGLKLSVWRPNLPFGRCGNSVWAERFVNIHVNRLLTTSHRSTSHRSTSTSPEYVDIKCLSTPTGSRNSTSAPIDESYVMTNRCLSTSTTNPSVRQKLLRVPQQNASVRKRQVSCYVGELHKQMVHECSIRLYVVSARMHKS